MIKKIKIFIILILLCFLLSGCNNSKETISEAIEEKQVQYKNYSSAFQNNQLYFKVVVDKDISDKDILEIYNDLKSKDNRDFILWLYSSEENANTYKDYEIASVQNSIIDRNSYEKETEEEETENLAKEQSLPTNVPSTQKQKTQTTNNGHEHMYSNWTSISKAEHQRKCECGHKESNPHIWGQKTETTPATCIEGSFFKHSCTSCNLELTEQGSPVSSAHTYGIYKVYVPATCTSYGEDRAYCYWCNSAYISKQTFVSHDYKYDDTGRFACPIHISYHGYAKCSNCGTIYCSY